MSTAWKGLLEPRASNRWRTKETWIQRGFVLATLLNLILLYQWYHSRTAKITLLDDFQMLWVVFFLTHLLPLCPVAAVCQRQF